MSKQYKLDLHWIFFKLFLLIYSVRNVQKKSIFIEPNENENQVTIHVNDGAKSPKLEMSLISFWSE